jgi:hypothetical protein
LEDSVAVQAIVERAIESASIPMVRTVPEDVAHLIDSTYGYRVGLSLKPYSSDSTLASIRTFLGKQESYSDYWIDGVSTDIGYTQRCVEPTSRGFVCAPQQFVAERVVRAFGQDGSQFHIWARGDSGIIELRLREVSAPMWVDPTRYLLRTGLAIEPGNIALPSLLRVWNEVSSLDPEVAERYLEVQQRASEEEVSILGLHVKERMLVIAVPIIMLGLSAFLLLHITHALQEAPALAHAVVCDPWPLLRDGPVGSWLRTLLILVLPAASLIGSLLRAGATIVGLELGERAQVFAIRTALLSLTSLLLCLATLVLLRQCVSQLGEFVRRSHQLARHQDEVAFFERMSRRQQTGVD